MAANPLAANPLRRTISYSRNPNEILVAFSPVMKPEPFVHAQQLRINVADTIGAVIARLAGFLNVPAADIVLTFNDNHLDPAHTVGFYGLENDSHAMYVLKD